MKNKLNKLALVAVIGFVLTLVLQSCATPLEKAAEARGKKLIANGSPVTQPPTESEIVLATYRGSYSHTRNVKGKLSLLDNAALLIGGIMNNGNSVPTIYHKTYYFDIGRATSNLLYRYVKEFPNTSIEEVEYLDVRSVTQLGSPEYSIQIHHSSYTDKKGKRHEEDSFDAITNYYFQGIVIRVHPQPQQYQYPPPQQQYQYPPPQQYQYPPPQQYQYPPPQQYQYPPPQQYQYPPQPQH